MKLVLFFLWAKEMRRKVSKPWFSKQIPSRRISFAVILGMSLGLLTVAGMELIHTERLWFDVRNPSIHQMVMCKDISMS